MSGQPRFSRRSLMAALTAAPLARPSGAQAQEAAPESDELAQARKRVQQQSAALRKRKIAIDAEPALRFEV